MMNPCAATFTPGTSSPEPGPEDDSHHEEKPGQIPTCPRSWRRKENARPLGPDALDPENYDTMFPSLSTSNPNTIPSSGHSSQPSCKKNRKKRKAQRLSTENEDVSNATPAASPEVPGSPASSKAEQRIEDHPTIEKKGLEIPNPERPNPIIHTPPGSSSAEQDQGNVSKPPSPLPPCVPGPGSMELVRITPHMPPTPQPDYEMPIQNDSAMVTYAAGPIPPQNVIHPQALPLPEPQFFPNAMAPTAMTPAPGPPAPVYYYPPPYLPYPTVYVTVPPVTWQPAFAQPSPVWPVPPTQPPVSWPQPLQATSVPGLQVQSRSSSREPSRRLRGSRGSSQLKRQSMDSKRTQLGNLLGIPRPASTAGHKTQVEVLKSKYRAKSSSPRRLASKYQVIENLGDQSLEHFGQHPTTAGLKVTSEHKGPNGTNTNEQVFGERLQQNSVGEEVFKGTPGLDVGQANQRGRTRSVVDVEDHKAGQPEFGLSKDQYSRNAPPSTEKSAHIPLSGPPTNAPKAPASQRRVTQGSITIPQQPSGSSPAENGGWSQSKRWMSKETKERVAFQKMQINLHYMSADKSPFVPQSPAELTAFKLEAAESKKLKLMQEVDKRLAKADCKNLVDQKGKKARLPAQLLGGKMLRDKLSPVFSAVHCFNKEFPTEDELRVDWPSLAELKEEGDKRASRYGRYFPLPRLNVIATRFSGEDREKAYNPDGSIRWEKKAVKLGAREIIPVNADSEAYTITPVVELRVEELPVPLQLIIKHIDGSQEDHDSPQEKNKDQEGK